MTDKTIANKAFELAEQEAQEKEIQKIKNIIQIYLERIQEKMEARKRLDDEIKALKADIDDFKAGRLDKIKERQDKDEIARTVSPIIIKVVQKNYVPLQPWRSPWIVEWKGTPCQSQQSQLNQLYPGGLMNTAYSTSLIGTMPLTCTGTSFSTFTSGTYSLSNNKIINL